MSQKLHRSPFLREVKMLFPDLARELNAQMGGLHFEVDKFRKFTQRKMLDGEREHVALCFSLAEKYYNTGNSAMRNAIDVSFVELLVFSTPRTDMAWAWDRFPRIFMELYESFHRKPGA
jgi:hypothetical protein